MLAKVIQRQNKSFFLLRSSQASFSHLVTHEVHQPPAVGSQNDYMIDTKMANSKYYNPHTFDPQNLDYQRDVRLSKRDELPDEIDSSDIAENLYKQLFMTELVWPVVFFGVYAAFEPDVSPLSLSFVHDLTSLYPIAHHSLPLGEGPSESNVPW